MRDHGSLFAAPSGGPWLFGKRADLWLFGGTALVSLFLIVLGEALGLTGDAPPWIWLACILCVDVAHVWSTIFRVYLDDEEVRRRRGLYLGVPLVCYGLGVFAYAWGPQMFWRCLAYVAVYHFVRQQYGWVAMYRGKAGEQPGLGKWIDTTAIYLATLYPLIYWHAHLPRNFWWFLPGSFTGIPLIVEQIAAPFYWSALTAYATRSLYRGWKLGLWNPGKDIVLVTTAVCWHVGIITFNSDYAFMVTNVIIHGIPYIVLIYWFHVRRTSDRPHTAGGTVRRVFLFLATLWFLAFVEELFWHRGHWHNREWLFGSGGDIGDWKGILIPLLAVPQITHYILDGFIWRRHSNPDLQRR